MRSSKSRSRSKANRPRTLGNIINRVFDSSGPEGKVRGTPQQSQPAPQNGNGNGNGNGGNRNDRNDYRAERHDQGDSDQPYAGGFIGDGDTGLVDLPESPRPQQQPRRDENRREPRPEGQPRRQDNRRDDRPREERPRGRSSRRLS